MRMQIGGPKLTVLELLPEKFMGLLSLRAGVDSGEVLFYDPQSRDCLPAAHADNIVLPRDLVCRAAARTSYGEKVMADRFPTLNTKLVGLISRTTAVTAIYQSCHGCHRFHERRFDTSESPGMETVQPMSIGQSTSCLQPHFGQVTGCSSSGGVPRFPVRTIRCPHSLHLIRFSII